jgi:Glycosyltransferase Family 4
VWFATDLIDSEGHVKVVTQADDIINLINIDSILLSNQSAVGNIWRNLVKMVLLPLQAVQLRRLATRHPVVICHAHSMYYMFLCWLAGLPFIGTPQGSEVLVRPHKSVFYKYFAIRALRAARHITVDSVNMQNAIQRLSGRVATIIQNGIDISGVQAYAARNAERTHVVSIRGLYPGYKIEQIVTARDASASKPALIFTYPSWEDTYKAAILARLRPDDRDLGRVMPKEQLYEILSAAVLAVSIPVSDSSPRSVYEAIFCGCCVAVTPSSWIEATPDCMKSRLVIVDVADPNWFEAALTQARVITREPYRPSETALNLFDQTEAARTIVDSFYGPQDAAAH